MYFKELKFFLYAQIRPIVVVGVTVIIALPNFRLAWKKDHFCLLLLETFLLMLLIRNH